LLGKDQPEKFAQSVSRWASCHKPAAKLPTSGESTMKVLALSLKITSWFILLMGCTALPVHGEGPDASMPATVAADYPGVPKSNIYGVTVVQGDIRQQLVVFQSSCPEYQPGYMNMIPVDQYPLKIFKGRSINWVNFSFSGRVIIEVRVLDTNKVPLDGPVKIFPSRYGLTPTIHDGVIRFTMTEPEQCSVEIGKDGYKNGLMIFANPPETDKPDTAPENYCALTNATSAEISAVPSSYSGIDFKSGVHDIGVYHVPANITNIYFEAGSWVYGALLMDGHSRVKIFGRGVLSEAKLNYRQAHAVEAIHDSDEIDLEGIVLADTKYFAVRLLGKNNTVKWVKIVGGWTYNTDGIAAFAGSIVSHCFVWANDDSLKPYQDNLNISDCVVWQLNNGGVIQLSWGNAKATNVCISNVDILHAEWNNDAANHGLLSCIGDKFAKGNLTSWQRSFLIKNVVTETPVPIIFNVRPNPASPDQIHGLTLQNWNVKMDMSKGFPNYIEGGAATNKFDGLVFDNFTLNGVKLTESNWINAGRFVITNLVAPVFTNQIATVSPYNPRARYFPSSNSTP
jgi:hypothetical protein